MRQAQIAIEDHRFYEHGALDFKGTLRALIRNSTSDDVQGGSSITQQYVKMVQIQACTAKGDSECVKEAQETTVERKIRELRYAIALEKKFTKDEILDPLPQHRLLRQGRVRGGGGRAVLLRRSRRRS